MTEDPIKATSRSCVANLVQKFKRNEADYLRETYNETQARTDFITPLLEAFGWDVHNDQGLPMSLRMVIEEAAVEVGEERLSKRPDYELRLARQRKLFVEAKKPSLPINRNRKAAFQIRQYGYSASLPISILTNFYQLAVYDCIPQPLRTDEAHVGRLLLFNYTELETRFDELWSLLSFNAVYSGEFDRRFAVDTTRQGAMQFDDYFLSQVRSWRSRLANDIHNNSPAMNPAEITFAVQLFLSRIIFLRICEDREIERYEALKRLPSKNTFNALMAEIRRADKFYDSGLFSLLNDERLGIRISDDVLQSIITELYYPQSPYTFAVIETEVLGEIYEQFLGEEITIDSGAIEIVRKPEIRESGGVVPTPSFIVDTILERTLVPVLKDKSPDDLRGFTVADICCGSGIFLISAYEFILDHYLSWYLENDPDVHTGNNIYETTEGQWWLTFEEKRRILLEHIRGVDIDPNAAEVTRLSLLLKLIENETADDLHDYVAINKIPVLPVVDTIIKCGNSLVSQSELIDVIGTIPTGLIERINPFTWLDEFPDEMDRGGFNVIVGNPPYIRIQKMSVYSPEEVAFYHNPKSPYTTAQEFNFDKYALFIERALTLLRSRGRLGFITPHKFMNTRSGQALRNLISSNQLLEEVIHFGVKQVFGRQYDGRGVSNYTCILILDLSGTDIVRIERPEEIEAWRYGKPGTIDIIQASELNKECWRFSNAETTKLFEFICANIPDRLENIAEIFVGVQTSADDIYIFPGANETKASASLYWKGQEWPIEKEILRPCIHDIQLEAYTSPKPNAWIILPYMIDCNNSRSRAHLIQPEEMAQYYPNCFKYLESRQQELEQRSISGGSAKEQQYYQYGRSQSLTKFNTPKIIFPILSLEPRYAYDDSNIFVTGGGNGPYYMVRSRSDQSISNYYIMAVLNHPISEAFVRTNTSIFRGGYYSHGKQFIKDLPIPLPTDLELKAINNLVVQLIIAVNAVDSAKTPYQSTMHERQAAQLRLEIEDYVTNLFGLSSSDMNIINAVPIPS